MEIVNGHKLEQEIQPFHIEIDKYRPYYYAGASLDFNLIHIDNDFAKKAGLGGIILQGLCTMAYVYRAVMGDNDPSKIKKLKVRFRQPVKPLDKITVKGNITDLVAENQKGEQVITNGSASMHC